MIDGLIGPIDHCKAGYVCFPGTKFYRTIDILKNEIVRVWDGTQFKNRDSSPYINENLFFRGGCEDRYDVGELYMAFDNYEKSQL